MKARYFGFVVAIASTLVACGKVEFSKVKGPECQGFQEVCITVDGVDKFDYTVRTKEQNFKTDILFIDDNSGSMAAEQQNMANRFDTFIGAISNLDWRVGIVTTDMNGTGPTQDGQLLQFTGTASDFFITPSTPNVNNLFANTIKRTETGYGDERGIYAAIKAIGVRRAERGFIRDDAHLAVVILSDEDERSDAGATPPPYGGPLEAGKDNPQDLIDLVNSTWSYEKSLTVHSIIIKPGDTACYNAQKAQPGGTANYGSTYSALTGLTGGVHGTVCTTSAATPNAPIDYGSQLVQIGNIIQQTTSSITLACIPLPGTLQVTPVNGWTQNADKIIFNPPLAPGSEVRLIYDCESRI